jgi:lipopolysaccharide/colanic/teichoic acid biosynthesis glycosyltransferase
MGLMLFAPLYGVGLVLQKMYLVTPLFISTLLWCVLPYLFAVHLIYKAAQIPAAEQKTVMIVNITFPFLVLVMGFALMQEPYARSAVLISAFATIIWFAGVYRLFGGGKRITLLVLDPNVVIQLRKKLGSNEYFFNKHVQIVNWNDVNSPIPECDGVLLSVESNFDIFYEKKLIKLKQAHVRLYSPAVISEMLSGRISQDVLNDPLWQPDGNPAYDLIKRYIDLVLVLLSLPIWLMLSMLVAVAIKFDSAGPVLFIQWRTGQNGKPFKLFKFRTMLVQEYDEAKFAEFKDVRITRLGKFLRRTRLDEIPQLVNVFLGQMSIIGPRPEQYSFVDEFAVSISSYPYRHLVRPGITGWAQVMQGYASSNEETAIKLSYDLYYIKHYSLALDLLVIAKTIRTVLTGFGAR